MAKKAIVGIDLGGTKVLVAVFDEDLNILERAKMRTRAHRGPEETVSRMATLVKKAVEVAGGEEKTKIAYVGIGAPGPLNIEEGIVRSAPNLGWHDVPLRKMLEKELGAPVNLDNDVNMGTYGECIAGAAKGKSLVVGIFPGTGIGGGIIIDGKVVHGASGSAGELGHIIVEPGGPLCGCGQRGCIEAIASRLAIAGEVAKAAFRGQSPFILDNYGTNITKLKSRAFAAAIEAKDEVVTGIVRHAARMLGLATANVINILSPEAIVLGGGLVEAMPKLFVEEVKRGVAEFALPDLVPTVKIVLAKLGDDSVVVGAAAYAGEVFKD